MFRSCLCPLFSRDPWDGDSDDDEYHVRDIVDHEEVPHRNGSRMLYKVLWWDYSDEEFTWESPTRLKNVKWALDKYKKRNGL